MREQKSSEKIRTKFPGEKLHVWGVLPALYEVSAEYNSLTPSFCSGWRFSTIADRFLSWFPRDCRILKWGNPKFSLRGRNGIRITIFFSDCETKDFAAQLEFSQNGITKFPSLLGFPNIRAWKSKGSHPVQGIWRKMALPFPCQFLHEVSRFQL